MSNVATTHAAYDRNKDALVMLRDVNEGARSVRAKAELYLPKDPGKSAADYAAFLKRAPFFGALKRTIVALAGAIFTRPPSVTVPPLLAPQVEDVTLRNESITDLALKLTKEVLLVGRVGILVDMAPGGGRPYLVTFSAESIINWREGQIGDDPAQLTMVVLREDVEVPSADGFGSTVETQYRELSLAAGDSGPVYQCRTWRRSDPSYVVSVMNTPWTADPWQTPSRRGVPLPFIPFVFVGPTSISPDVEKPPLEDLADLILQHYRNGADHEEGLHLIALPTPWASGIIGNDQQLKIGPSICWKLEKDGRVGMNEFSGEGLAAIREAMAAKERQMSVLGGRLLLEEPHGQAAETATSARLRYSGEAASLRTIAGSTSAALTLAMRWWTWWQIVADALPLDVRVDLPHEFFQTSLSADEVRAALFATQAGEMSSETFYALLQRGWARPGVTVEQERKAIEAGPGCGSSAAAITLTRATTTRRNPRHAGGKR